MPVARTTPPASSTDDTRVMQALPSTSKDSLTTTLEVEKVYRECGTRIYSLARRMLGNDIDAEDVAQEVLLQVVRGWGNFRGEASVMTWLYRVTVNAALALRRKRSICKERQFAEAWESPEDNYYPRGYRPSTAPDSQVLHGELRDRIETAIARLPDTYRDSFILADIEELSYAEIGDILGLSLAAVKSRIHRARLMLRDALQPYLNADGRRAGIVDSLPL